MAEQARDRFDVDGRADSDSDDGGGALTMNYEAECVKLYCEIKAILDFGELSRAAEIAKSTSAQQQEANKDREQMKLELTPEKDGIPPAGRNKRGFAPTGTGEIGATSRKGDFSLPWRRGK